jgi:glycosyltransferase involved in cell wall biosynthesis
VWFKELLKRRIIRNFSAGLVGGRPHADYLCELGLSRERIFTGYDVVDNAYFSVTADAVRNNAAVERARLGLPANYFLACARFLPKKNLRRLIEAYGCYRQSALQAGRPDESLWRLVIVGDGALRPELEQTRFDLGLERDVVMPGFQTYDQLPVYYGLAGAFVHASATEQWGLVVNEAMASGLPVLVSRRCGCARDLVEEGRNGFTFDPDDVKSLARYMSGFASGEHDCAGMGRASRDIVSRWTPETFAKNLWSAVEIALQNPVPRAGIMDGLVVKMLCM